MNLLSILVFAAGVVTPVQAILLQPGEPNPAHPMLVQDARPGIVKPKEVQGGGTLAKVNVRQGVQQIFTKESRIAPFQVTTPAGSENYFLKLVKGPGGAAVLTFYVRGGQTFDLKVPLGTYRLKYASGETWYGFDNLFGENTAYSEAETTLHFTREGNTLKGHRIVPIKQVGGNLPTKRIPKKDF
ncbi:MAG: hypothetical protein ACREC6_10175 [Hyphomicrobiaceae bacterium]